MYANADAEKGIKQETLAVARLKESRRKWSEFKEEMDYKYNQTLEELENADSGARKDALARQAQHRKWQITKAERKIAAINDELDN